MRIAEEQIDRLILLMQKSRTEIDKLFAGSANRDESVGIFYTHPWEKDFTNSDRGE
jgi:hypothetical protein